MLFRSLPLRNHLRVQATTACLRGLKPANDDCLGVRIPDEPLLTTKGVVAVIADGVSVAEKGRDAAEICVQGFLNDYYDTPDAWSVTTAAQKVLNALNRWLYQLGQSYTQASRGFVTTLSVLVIKGNTGHLFHVGDSRIGRVRDGEWEWLTRDHTARLSDEHRQLTRAMGLDVKLDVDYRQVTVREGDVYCLTTDGAHEWLPEPEIAKLATASTVANGSDVDEPAARITQAALARGSTDNTSAIVVRVEELAEIRGEEVYRQVKQLPFPPELSAGMIIDGYEVEQQLEASARSQVYLVRDTATRQLRVMKTPSVNYEDDTAYLERFAMESWIAKCVDSPHVVKLLSEPGRQRFLYNLFE